MGTFKYKELQNRDWLYQKHVLEKLSCRQIASLIGVKYYTSVRDALHRLNIPTSRPRKHAPKGLSSYDKLNDISWLTKQYINNKRDLNDISKEVGCLSSSTIRDMLITHGIRVRRKSEAYISRKENGDIIFNQNTWDVINGSLLGDGWLNRRNRNVNASFCKKNIHYEHICFVAKILFGEQFKKRIRGPLWQKKLGLVAGRQIKTSSPFFTLGSLVHKELSEIYDAWYRNGKKTIPSTLVMNRTVLLHWFLDDGYSYYHGSSVRIGLCSQSFSKKDQNTLRKMLYDNFGIKTALAKKDNSYFISIHSKKENVRRFYNAMGECPLKCFEYKWKLPK